MCMSGGGGGGISWIGIINGVSVLQMSPGLDSGLPPGASVVQGGAIRRTREEGGG